MFDPKKIMDSALDQVQKSTTGKPYDHSKGVVKLMSLFIE